MSVVQRLQELAEKNPEVRQALAAIAELTTTINKEMVPIIESFRVKHPTLPVDILCGALAAYVGGVVHALGGNIEHAKKSLEGGHIAARSQGVGAGG